MEITDSDRHKSTWRLNDRAAKRNDWIVKSGAKIMANTVLITGASQGNDKATALLVASKELS
jgi:hypothetical protein